MQALTDEVRAQSLVSRVCFIARARYGVLRQDAEDIFHEAIATYLVIPSPYPPKDNHFGILVGIFHKKVLEHLGGRDCDSRVTKRFVARLKADRPHVARGEDPRGAAVERVIRNEDATLIRDAIGTLGDEAREMMLRLAEGSVTRLEMIEMMGVNRNTFDTRLRAIRQRLRRTLEKSGVL